MLKAWVLAGILAVAGWPAMAQNVARVDRIETAWRDWAIENDIQRTAIAIGRGAEMVRSAGIGRTASQPVEIASLSKTISAMCLAVVLYEQNIGFDAKIAPYLPRTYGASSAALTFGDLVSQTSGLDEDETQIYMWRWLNQRRDQNRNAANIALSRGPNPATAGEFFYNNENFAIIGWLISELTNQPYFTACKNRIFGPGSMGASRSWGAFGAWGGWRISAEDYLDFLLRYFGPASSFAPSPTFYPSANLGEGKHYGMGAYWRANPAGGFNFWHLGRLCFRGQNRAGAYFVNYGTAWTVTVNYNACLSDEAAAALDAALRRAVTLGQPRGPRGD